MRRVVEQLRAAAIRVADRFGWRDRLRLLNERFSPSGTVRRDARDHRHLDVLLAATLAPDDLCVDIGANVGNIAQAIVRVAPDAKHVLAEPLPDLAARLAERFPNCEVHALACSDHEGTEEFVRVVERPTRSGLRPGQVRAGMTTETISVPVTTVDALLAGRRPRLVKIDVEGTELEVLQGATATLAHARPVVVFEHQPTADLLDTQTRGIHRLFAGAQYRVFDIDGNGPFTEDALVEVCRHGRVWNFVATPANPS